MHESDTGADLPELHRVPARLMLRQVLLEELASGQVEHLNRDIGCEGRGELDAGLPVRRIRHHRSVKAGPSPPCPIPVRCSEGTSEGSPRSTIPMCQLSSPGRCETWNGSHIATCPACSRGLGSIHAGSGSMVWTASGNGSGCTERSIRMAAHGAIMPDDSPSCRMEHPASLSLQDDRTRIRG